jgi:hypothetical protein
LIQTRTLNILGGSACTSAEAKFSSGSFTKDIDINDLCRSSVDNLQDLGGPRRLWDSDLSDSLANNLGLLGCVADGDLFNLVILLRLTLLRGGDLRYR